MTQELRVYHYWKLMVPFLHISYYNYSCFHVDSNRSTSGSQGDLRYVLFYNSIKDFYPDPGCPRIFFYDLMFRLHLKIDKPGKSFLFPCFPPTFVWFCSEYIWVLVIMENILFPLIFLGGNVTYSNLLPLVF